MDGKREAIPDDIMAKAREVKEALYERIERWEGDRDAMELLVTDIGAALLAVRDAERKRCAIGTRLPEILRGTDVSGVHNKKRPRRAAQAIPLVPPAWRWIETMIGIKTP